MPMSRGSILKPWAEHDPQSYSTGQALVRTHFHSVLNACLTRYLKYSITSSVRSQDSLNVILYVSDSHNIIGNYLGWEFIKRHWPYLEKKSGSFFFESESVITSATYSRFGNDAFFGDFIVRTTMSFATEKYLQEVHVCIFLFEESLKGVALMALKLVYKWGGGGGGANKISSSDLP